jgi:alpha-mannosidase
LTVEPPAFAVTSIKQAVDGSGMIVRGVNLDSHPLQVKLESYFAIQSATLTRLDETPIQPLEIIDNHALHLNVDSKKIVTIHLNLLET